MSEIWEKIAAVSKEVQPLTRDTAAYTHRYADLNQVLDKLGPELDKHNLVILFTTDVVGQDNLVCLVVRDGDEELMASSLVIPRGIGPQDMGGAITYFRRYMLVALFNLRTYDDDAQAAQASSPVTNAPQPKRRDLAERISSWNGSPQQWTPVNDEPSPAQRIAAALKGRSDAQHYKDQLHDQYGSWKDLTAEQQVAAADYLESLISMGGTFEEEK